MNAPRPLITMESIHIEVNIINHPYSSIAISNLLALSPQNRLIKIIRVITYQSNRMRGTDGMLNGLTSSFVDQRKGGEPLLILHPRAVLLLLVPMLVVISGVGWSKNDIAIPDGKGEIGGSPGEEPDSALVGRHSDRGFVMSVVVNERRQVGAMGLVGLVGVHVMRNMVHRSSGVRQGSVSRNSWRRRRCLR